MHTFESSRSRPREGTAIRVSTSFGYARTTTMGRVQVWSGGCLSLTLISVDRIRISLERIAGRFGCTCRSWSSSPRLNLSQQAGLRNIPKDHPETEPSSSFSFHVVSIVMDNHNISYVDVCSVIQTSRHSLQIWPCEINHGQSATQENGR